MSLENNPELGESQISRRAALKLLGKSALAVTAATVVPQIFEPSRVHAQELKLNNEVIPPQGSIIDDIAQFGLSAVEPVVTSQGYGLGQVFSAPIFKRLGVPFGTHISDEKVQILGRANNREIVDKSHLYGIVYNAGVWFSDAISTKITGSTPLVVKVVMSGMMGLASNAIYKGHPDRPQSAEPEFMSGWKIPAYQIADNLFYWQLMEKHGFLRSTIARSIKDVSVLLAGKYLHRSARGLANGMVTVVAPPQAVDEISRSVIARSLGKKS